MTLYTTNYNLDKYEGIDKPNLRDQYNSAMDKIDSVLKTVDTTANDLTGRIEAEETIRLNQDKILQSSINENTTNIENLNKKTDILNAQYKLNNFYMGRIHILNASFDSEKTFKRLDPINFSFEQAPNSGIYPSVTYSEANDSPFKVVALIPDFYNQDGNVIVENISLNFTTQITSRGFTYYLKGGTANLVLVKYDFAGAPAYVNAGIRVIAGTNIKTKY